MDLLEEVLWQKFPPLSPPPPLKLGAKVFSFLPPSFGGGRDEGWSCAYGRNGRRAKEAPGGEDIYGTRKGGIPFSRAGAEGNFEKTLPQKSRYPLLAFSYPFFSRKYTRLFSRIRDVSLLSPASVHCRCVIGRVSCCCCSTNADRARMTPAFPPSFLHNVLYRIEEKNKRESKRPHEISFIKANK